MSDELKPLDIPQAVIDSNDGVELIRFWISQQKEQIALRVGAFGDGEVEPAMWGNILADIARHVLTIMAERNEEGAEAQVILNQMMDAFQDRLLSFEELPTNIAKRAN